MSAAPLSKPEAPPAEQADDGWALLDALRRKLDDQAAQTRKATAQVGQLAESIAALVELQRKRSRWRDLNSFAAYLVFTILLGGAFYFVYQSRANELVRRADDAVRRADDASARAVARDAADAKALEAWQLLEAGKRAEAQKRIDELAPQPLPRLEREVLAQRAKQADPAPHGENPVEKASAAFKTGRLADVIATTEAALAADPHGKQAAELHYFAGLAFARLGQLDRAVPSFDAAVAAEVPEDDARFQLASALDRAGQWARAKTEYEKFAAARPQSPFAAFASRRVATLSHPVQPAPPATQPTEPAPAAAASPKAADPPAIDPTPAAVP
ncbi:MAG TPA: hypothetical protein VGF94_20220 [Kofleriaceae bacterium]